MKETLEHITVDEKVQHLREESEGLMAIADSFAKKGVKEQFRTYLIQAIKKNRESQKLSTAVIEKQLEELEEFLKKNCPETEEELLKEMMNFKLDEL